MWLDRLDVEDDNGERMSKDQRNAKIAKHIFFFLSSCAKGRRFIYLLLISVFLWKQVFPNVV